MDKKEKTSQHNWQDVKQIIRKITTDAAQLLAEKTNLSTAKVCYCAIFCKNNHEYETFKRIVEKQSVHAKDTSTGPVFITPTITTNSGPLNIVKVRRPDPTRKERGDADFKIEDYKLFKKKILNLRGVKTIVREDFEMIEIKDQSCDARVYISDPPVDQHENVQEALRKFFANNI